MNARSWTTRADQRSLRLARAASALGTQLNGKLVANEAVTDLLHAVIEPHDRVCLEGNNQKQADFLAQALVQPGPATRAPPAHGAVGAGAAGTPGPLRPGHRLAAGLQLLRPAGRPPGQAGGRAAHRDRRDPHLPGTVRALLRRPDAPGGAGGRAGRRPARQPLHRAQHRGHTGHRRGHRVFGRHRDRAGQRDHRRPAATHRHPGRLGGLRRAGAAAERHRTAVHARPGADQRDPGADGHDGHQGHLRALRRAAPEPRHRLRHCRDRTAAAHLCANRWA